jgi:hypothetical protein
MFGLAAALYLGAQANATIIIPTNLNGADTEVRESSIIDDFGTTTNSNQFGGHTELATRGIDTTTTANNDRSSIMFMKFDVSGLPNHTTNAAFWADKNLYFKGYVRNTNLTDSRLKFPTAPAGVSPTHIVNFDIRGLEPGHVYADDDPNAANRVDRSGNAYSAPGYKYNWAEGIGTGANNLASGISFIDAPGITPHCMAAGSCAAAYGDGDVNNIHKTLGKYDDFNSDARYLGNWQWPLPNGLSPGSNRYPVGLPLEYTDTNGNLKQLVFDAQDAGRSFVTLMLNLAVDTLLDPTSSSSGDGPGPGTFPNNTFLNHNYLFNPKEKLVLENDSNWDPDGSGPIGTIGSPYSCLHANCNGDGTPTGDTVLRALGQNPAATGPFSPQLIVRVPEPASAMLLALGSLALAAARRRK